MNMELEQMCSSDDFEYNPLISIFDLDVVSPQPMNHLGSISKTKLWPNASPKKNMALNMATVIKIYNFIKRLRLSLNCRYNI